MAISTHAAYLTSSRQKARFVKLAAVSAVTGVWFSTFNKTAEPAAGTLAGGNTANGVVPIDNDAGYPTLGPTSGTTYLARALARCNQLARLALFDRVFLAGAYNFNSAVTLTAQPSFSGRVPGGDYSGLEIWAECAAAITGTLNITVTYTNEAGTAGRTTGAVALTSISANRCQRLPLQAGDSGVQLIESVTCTVATAGTAVINVMVLRHLWTGNVRDAGAGLNHDYIKTGLPQVYDTSALYCMIQTDASVTPTFDMVFELASG